MAFLEMSRGQPAGLTDDPDAPADAKVTTAEDAGRSASDKLNDMLMPTLSMFLLIDVCVVIHFSVAVAKRLVPNLFRRGDPITPRGFDVIPK